VFLHPEVLEIVGCACATDTPWSTAICGCYEAHFSCTMFCECYGEAYCQNWQIRQVDDSGNQARNQLGTLGGKESFLRGAQTCLVMSNNSKLCATHFQGGKKSFKRTSPPCAPLVTGLMTMLLNLTCLRTEWNHFWFIDSNQPARIEKTIAGQFVMRKGSS